MPLTSYGVLSAIVADTRREGAADSPHYQIRAVDDTGTSYRIAVNVLSSEPPSELLYLVDDDFRHPLTTALPPARSGWTALPPGPGGANLDFIRANLFHPADMRPLPPDAQGSDNDLADVLDHYVQRARGDATITLCALGAPWGPDNTEPDKVFGFLPGRGVHEIHMNQGNADAFVRDDGVWQDGGLLLHLAAEDRWVAIFLAFQSQSWHTDDTTGHTIPGTGPRSDIPGTEPVRVIAALVNPAGHGPEAETVTLINASPAPIDITGWRIADRSMRTCGTPALVLDAGAVVVAPLTGGVALGNSGGAITLLDPQGLKVHGVAYTRDEAHREGWTVTF